MRRLAPAILLLVVACRGAATAPLDAPAVALDAPTLTGRWRAVAPTFTGGADTLDLALTATPTTDGALRVTGTGTYTVLVPVPVTVTGEAHGAAVTLQLVTSSAGLPAGATPPTYAVTLQAEQQAGALALVGQLRDGPFVQSVTFRRTGA